MSHNMFGKASSTTRTTTEADTSGMPTTNRCGTVANATHSSCLSAHGARKRRYGSSDDGLAERRDDGHEERRADDLAQYHDEDDTHDHRLAKRRRMGPMSGPRTPTRAAVRAAATWAPLRDPIAALPAAWVYDASFTGDIALPSHATRATVELAATPLDLDFDWYQTDVGVSVQDVRDLVAGLAVARDDAIVQNGDDFDFGATPLSLDFDTLSAQVVSRDEIDPALLAINSNELEVRRQHVPPSDQLPPPLIPVPPTSYFLHASHDARRIHGHAAPFASADIDQDSREEVDRQPLPGPPRNLALSHPNVQERHIERERIPGMTFATFFALWEAGARPREPARKSAQAADSLERPLVRVLGTYTVEFDMKQEEQEPYISALDLALPIDNGAGAVDIDPTALPYAILERLAMPTPAQTPEPVQETKRALQLKLGSSGAGS